MVGVNVTKSVWVPAVSTVPAGGLYTNVPATLAVASNCVELRAVELVIAAGAAHVMVGVVAGGVVEASSTVMLTEAVALL